MHSFSPVPGACTGNFMSIFNLSWPKQSVVRSICCHFSVQLSSVDRYLLTDILHNTDFTRFRKIYFNNNYQIAMFFWLRQELRKCLENHHFQLQKSPPSVCPSEPRLSGALNLHLFGSDSLQEHSDSISKLFREHSESTKILRE